MNNNCINCKYFGTGGCVHPHKVNCVNSSLWAPRWYCGKRAELCIFDDYCSREIMNEVFGETEVLNED